MRRKFQRRRSEAESDSGGGSCETSSPGRNGGRENQEVVEVWGVRLAGRDCCEWRRFYQRRQKGSGWCGKDLPRRATAELKRLKRWSFETPRHKSDRTVSTGERRPARSAHQWHSRRGRSCLRPAKSARCRNRTVNGDAGLRRRNSGTATATSTRATTVAPSGALGVGWVAAANSWC